MKDTFIEHQRARRRLQDRLSDKCYSDIREKQARRNAIIQAWAEVTDQTWHDAAIDLAGERC
jgi:hypothetical protein